jgi:hypothetical protein
MGRGSDRRRRGRKARAILEKSATHQSTNFFEGRFECLADPLAHNGIFDIFARRRIGLSITLYMRSIRLVISPAPSTSTVFYRARADGSRCSSSYIVGPLDTAHLSFPHEFPLQIIQNFVEEHLQQIL